ncbi:MAG: hypothetical protein IKP00_08415 [Victivallales bacterium]|nr:hypothetical protein [Victivallales bacterium]
MAKGLSETAKKLDTDTNTGKSGKLDYKEPQPGVKESGAFAYVKYKENPSEFEKNVNEVGAIASTVITQRNELAETIVSLSKNLGIEEGTILDEDLKASGTYAGKLSLPVTYSKAVKDRELDMLDGIKLVSRKLKVGGADSLDSSIGIETGEDDTMTAKYNGSEGLFDKMGKCVDEMNSTIDTYEKWLKGLTGYVKNYKWTAKTASIDSKSARGILDTAKKDMEGINGKLVELVRVKSELEEKLEELKKREDEIAKLKEECENLAKDNEKLKKENRELGGDRDDRPILESIDQINTKVVGYVLLDNSEWNYVITDLSNKDIVKGVTVVISDETGKFLASGNVSKAEDKISLIEITRRSGSIPQGAKVFMGADVSSGSDDD